MRITLCASISCAAEVLRARDALVAAGHEVFVPQSIIDFSVENAEQAERLKADRAKYLREIKPRYTRLHFEKVAAADAILVVNAEKNGIAGYIGGATFAEVMVALYLGKKIFFLNPIPADKRFDFIRDELEAAGPVVLGGDVARIGKA